VLKVLARMFLATSVALSTCPFSYAQLPNTNMGKFVHQPGDNQYDAAAQSARHGPPADVVRQQLQQQQVQQQNAAAAVYHPVKAAPRPDYSVMPISCDEPIKPPGFPPLPDRLDFGSAISSSRFGDQGSGLHFGGGGGGADGGGANSGRYVPPQPTGVHQHYTHYDPGAFIPPNQQPGAHHSGYKVNTPSTDYYNANSAPADDSPKFQSDAGQQLKRMGPQPRLAPDQAPQATAPTPVTVNQAVTQDLSLPDDQTTSGQALNQNTLGKRFVRRTGQMLMMPVNQAGSQAAGAAGMAGSMLHR
jgi:hypothetical protein